MYLNLFFNYEIFGEKNYVKTICLHYRYEAWCEANDFIQ
jgi:hypothetical protein